MDELLDLLYGEENLAFTRKLVAGWENHRVIVVRYDDAYMGWGYDVWVGPGEDKERMASTSTEMMAISYAKGFLGQDLCGNG